MRYPFAVLGIFLTLVASMKVSSAADPQDEFGKIFKQLMEAAPEDFKSVRGEASFIKNPDGNPMNWKSTLKLPGAKDAAIWAPRQSNPYYWLGIQMFREENEGAVQKATEDYAALVKKVRECLPEEWKSNETKAEEAVLSRVRTTFIRDGDKMPSSVEITLWTGKKSANLMFVMYNKR